MSFVISTLQNIRNVNIGDTVPNLWTVKTLTIGATYLMDRNFAVDTIYAGFVDAKFVITNVNSSYITIPDMIMTFTYPTTIYVIGSDTRAGGDSITVGASWTAVTDRFIVSSTSSGNFLDVSGSAYNNIYMRTYSKSVSAGTDINLDIRIERYNFVFVIEN